MSPGGELFVVFGDSTNGKETYGGGRFLYADWPGPDGVVTLDFNRAYNPPCVFTPWATCPLPPPQNKLAMAIEAGEKTYTGPSAAAHSADALDRRGTVRSFPASARHRR